VSATESRSAWARLLAKIYEVDLIGGSCLRSKQREPAPLPPFIFDVRRTYMDWFFLDEFLTREIIEKLGLYVYVENDKDTYYKTVVEETDWRKVKRTLVQSMMNWGVPRIQLMDGNYQGSLQLYLSHAYEGLPLDDEYCRKTLEHIFSLWGRPVYLETREPHNGSTSAKLYVIDGRGIHVRSD
jgi:spore cortex formation protein SpoVR/YcgB (stage V sporulation)